MVPGRPSSASLEKELFVVDELLREILACPRCLGHPLRFEAEEIICPSADCGLRYPIRDDIPVMLIEEATDPLTGAKVDPESERARPVRASHEA